MYVKKSQKYIPLMGDTRICKIAEHTFFFDIQNTAAEPPKDLLVFIPLTIKSLFLGVMGFSSIKKATYVLSKDKVGLWYYCH